MSMTIELCALDSEIVDAWAIQFGNSADVSLFDGDILSRSADAIVSPANSFGYMDGGIDLAYANFFGWELQDKLQRRIRDVHAGELPVGFAEVIPTEHRDIRLLISAPTMRVPSPIADTVNVYLAFRAALLAAQRANVKTLISPALGTGIGGMPPERSARQMHAAYAEVIGGDTSWRSTARGVLKHHAGLLA